MKEVLIKVKFSNSFKVQDIVEELREGIHCITGSGDPSSDRIRALQKTKITPVTGTLRINVA